MSTALRILGLALASGAGAFLGAYGGPVAAAWCALTFAYMADLAHGE